MRKTLIHFIESSSSSRFQALGSIFKFQIPNSRLYSSRYRIQYPNTRFHFQVSKSKFRFQDPKFQVPFPSFSFGYAASFKLSSLDFKLQNSGSRYQALFFKLQNPVSKFESQNSWFTIPSSWFHFQLPIPGYNL